MTTAFRGHGLPPRADPGEKALGGLVGGALRDELAAAGALAHRAAERRGARSITARSTSTAESC